VVVSAIGAVRAVWIEIEATNARSLVMATIFACDFCFEFRVFVK
jgi:hypothetical protein